MTVSTANRVVTYTGNGATTIFPYTFKINKASDASVVLLEIATGVETTVPAGQYTLTGVGSDLGGTLIYPLSGSPIASTHKISLVRTVPYIQELDITNEDGFYPDNVELQLDKIVMQVQQLANGVDRAPKMPFGYSAPKFPLPEDGKYISWFGQELVNRALIAVNETLPGVANTFLMRNGLNTAFEALSVDEMVSRLGIGSFIMPEKNQALGTAVRVEPCVTTAGLPNVQCVNANWTQADVGKVFFLKRGGAAGTDTRAMHLVSTIASVIDGQNITLADNVQQTLTTVAAVYGDDDTVAWQTTVAEANSTGKSIRTAVDAKYLITGPMGALRTGLTGEQESAIYAAYDDNDLTDGSESIFLVEDDGVFFEGLEFEWFGYFKKSYISAVNHRSGKDCRYIGVKATGFSGPGIQYGTNSTGVPGDELLTQRALFSGCNLSENRIAGILIGYSSDTTLANNWVNGNGLLGDGGTGYGMAGVAGTKPVNVLMLGNHGHDNHRRAFDFHAGRGIKIIGNFALRNKITAIYAEDTEITGDVIIVGNTVGDMTWNGTISSGVPGEGSAGQMFGIHVGAQSGQGLLKEPTNVIIAENIIYNFTSTTGVAPIAIFAHSGGWSIGSLQVKNNTVRCGVVSNLLRTSPNTAGAVGNYFDVDVQGNTFIADECTSMPIYFQGATNRKKIFKGNTLKVTTCALTAGAMTYDTTVVPEKSYIVEGNIVNVPASAWSSGFDWCMTKRVADENVRNNIVNNVKDREWDGVIFTDRAAAMPTTNHWVAGSYVVNSTAPGPNVPLGWQRITTSANHVLGTDWRAIYITNMGYQTVATDAAFSLTPASSPYATRHTGTLTADRAVTLTTTGAVAGVTRYRITRTGGGAFNLNVGTGPLKALATNTWGEFEFDGAAYYLAAYGAL